MNSGNNSEYYKQKYLKYKFKYLEQKKLVGGVLKPCPNEFGIFERQSIIRLLNKYDCNYNYFNGTTYDNYLFNINTKELEDINNIKLLKQKDFPLNFFCKDEIIKKKECQKICY